MASLQALCSICGKTVTAFSIVSDKEIKLLLDSNQEVVVRHVFADGSGNRQNTGGVSARRRRTFENWSIL